MTTNQFSSLFSAFWADLRDPGLLWQIAALAFCMVAGWGLARLLRLAFTTREVRLRVVRFGVESFTSVLSPVMVLLLILVVKPILAQWQQVNLLRVAIPLAASFAVIRFAFYVMRRIFVRSGGQAGKVLQTFEKVFATVVWCGVALYILGIWPEMVQLLEDVVVPAGRYKISVWTILQAALSVFVTLLLALWAGAALEERVMRVDTVHSSLRVVTARMGRAVLILIAVLLSLSLVGIDLTVLSVFGGALGVGIGLGLQKIVSSYVSGFVILLERSLAIGDMVAVDKYYGKVTQINTRYTILQGLDGVESVIPNEMLISGAVQNYSLTDRILRLSSSLTVAYETDIEELLPALEQAAAGIDRVLKNPPPAAVLAKFGADGFEIEIGFWISDPENGRMSVVSDVNRAFWRMLQARDVQVPYPQREVRVLNEVKT
ncbi:MAG TPA: mechanosensitive ion channel domain-containing protein [Paucimonas sp.]|nr:mechanosensitive ion channel domain-containing protein [Paucimonas sp.]